MSTKDYIKIALGQLSFFTILPSPKVSIEEVARGSFIAPLIVGFILSIIEYVVYYIFWIILGDYSKYTIIIIAEILRGFNHLDGLLDFGDGIMVKGSADKKVSAMKDKMVGSGGLGMFLIYLLLILSTIKFVPNPNSISSFLIILFADIISRALSLILLAITNPIVESHLAKLFNKELKKKLGILLILYSPFIIITIPTFVVSLLSLLLFREISLRSFKGVSGDVAGALITLLFPILLASNTCLSLSPYHYLLT
ncbi:MAG: adenosylcobinamide-GDP ribazoletransferase [Sulfolobaceae archaeon]